jgi:hypothetical protein
MLRQLLSGAEALADRRLFGPRGEFGRMEALRY